MFFLIFFIQYTLAFGQGGYDSLLPSASDIKIKKVKVPNLPRLLKGDFEACLVKMNQELTHRQEKSAESGTMIFLVTTQYLKVVKVEDKNNLFKGKIVRNCVREKLLALKLPDSHSKSKVRQNLRIDVICQFSRQAVSWSSKDKLHRVCQIKASS